MLIPASRLIIRKDKNDGIFNAIRGCRGSMVETTSKASKRHIMGIARVFRAHVKISGLERLQLELSMYPQIERGVGRNRGSDCQ